MKIIKTIFGIIAGVSIFLGTIALFGLTVMLLWNALLPGIFGLPVIQFWQAAGLLFLARVLFGGLGEGLSLKFGGKNVFREKWLEMSETERSVFAEKHKSGLNFEFNLEK